MNFLFNMRISQKIMALVAGLVLGFIAIGVTYFVQVNLQTKQAVERTALNEAQAQLMTLASQVSLVTSGQQEEGAITELQASLARLEGNALLSGRTELSSLKGALSELTELKVEEQSVAEGEVNYTPRVDALGARLMAENAALASSVAALNEAAFRYRLAPTANHYEQYFNRVELLRPNVASEQLLVDHAAAFEELAYSLKNGAVLAEREKNIIDSLNVAISSLISNIGQQMQAAELLAAEQAQQMVAVFIVMVSIIVTATAVGVYFLYKSIVFPMTHIQSVIRRINRGKLKARVKLIENDELGDLGLAFNQLLDDRIQNLEEQSLENERLNNSIISLIRAVGTIARKDLTIKVPVSSDITGTVSDAINLLTSETASALMRVKSISAEVDSVADVLKSQSAIVVRVAEDERKQVMATAKALDTSAKAMNEIANRAGSADSLAKGAIENTQQARQSVEQAVDSILAIRETITETEKRIKRLGDRSQEVSGIVNLINTIAERTHILALNASMHAASAGEAGKGFAVVADEVQRLAENAREATADISSMVNNIRVETSDTVAIMNKLIAEVAEGTKTAEVAGRRMNDTDKATNELVGVVGEMAQSAVKQAEVTGRVRDRAMIIRNFTEKTGSQLSQQVAYTDSLKNQSAALVEQVNLFKLPKDEAEGNSVVGRDAMTKAS